MRHTKDRWQIPCLRAVIGDQVYYSTLMNANQIADRIETAQQIREAKTLDEYLQRELKPRSRKITKYIQTEAHRFFSSIIVGVFGSLPDWVSFDLTKVAAATNMAHDENVEDSLEPVMNLRLTF